MNDMKLLLAGIVLILVIGFAGFFYRNTMERFDDPQVGACTLDAKICPDGTSLGRTGPECTFAQCPFPNAEFPDAGLSFVIPDGYELRAGPAGDSSMVAVYEKTGTTTPPHTIFIHRYAIPEGVSAEEVILANTTLSPSDMRPESIEKYSPRVIASRTFLSIVIERFEAQVHSAYFLPRENDVLAFEVIERDITNWTEPDLIVANLPEHQTLLRLLSSLQVAP
ncbi:MAG: hypothetical protein KBC38_01915 [Candidatus Pacebacteria bacterium]|nr:hypothetical protein [Candidatus Paceibacterota bacterium]MBP9840050.1 hypothetical protein [Candidatus Paceibacterota bacterium]